VSEHPVVAGYSGLDSADAVGLAALLARALDEPLVLARAYRYEPVALSARVVPLPDNARRADAAANALQQARRMAGPGIDVRDAVIPSVGIAEALIGLVQDRDACMLVLGRDTRGRVTRSLIPRSPCPVAVAPLSAPLPRSAPVERIGVAFDGSPTARWALVAATRLALALDAELAILAVGASAAHAATSAHIAGVAVEPTAARWTSSALVGDPKRELAARSAGLDLLVCGSRGLGRPLATVLGSVSAHLVTHAQCPVVVVPPGVWRNDDRPLGITCAAAGD
jgi:nucleotide-binding universal stress UspA family protein